MMTKVIPPGSFAFDEPMARLVDIHSRGIDSSWMTKRAAVFTDQIANMRPESGASYIHLISMGAQEAYGFNRNGDGFNEKEAEWRLECPKPGVDKIIKLAGGLLEYHNPTFEKMAHVFKHHKNTDPSLAIGHVKSAAYNPDMRRGELIIKVSNDHPDWREDLQKLSQGKDIPFSMACKVAYDICSVCGNRARSRAEYCDDLKNHMSEITKAGNQIGAINDRPNFFDISKVFRPADRIAWSLQKVASACMDLDLAPLGGAELAEMMGVSAPAILWGGPGRSSQKLAAARKLAAIEKTIEGVARGTDNSHLAQLAPGCPCGSVPDDAMESMRNSKLGSVLRALNDAQICLSVHDFFRLVTGSNFDSVSDSIPMVESMLPGMFGRMSSEDAEECSMDGAYDPSNAAIPRQLRDLVSGLVGDHSLASGPVGRRLSVTIIRGAKPKVQVPQETKLAAVSKKSADMSKEYAKYMLSFVGGSDENALTSDLTVLRHYVIF
jgi:hypothetical protein